MLQVRDLQTSFRTDSGYVPAVDGVSFDVGYGETVGIVGESGCGKTLTSLSILGLVPKPGGAITGGSITFEGRDLTRLTERELRAVRGKQISMIFQEPMTSLNPVYTLGTQISDILTLHQGLRGRSALREAVEMLKLVGIPNPEQRVKEYPHHLSGGMRQRVMIAMALSCRPKLLIADEPTTALDVTIQAQILDILRRLREEIGMSLLLITHALGVVAETADRVVVMYAGQVVEEAHVRNLFRHPRHPYTIGLLNSMPKINAPQERLHVIHGSVPSIFNVPPGCRFHPRCSQVMEVCRASEPGMISLGGGHSVRCWLGAGLGGAACA